ncbi:MAG: hypothetical protein MUC81_06580 [Bacteroidia bacterium]|jgi:hypothetical protein|nr:hypothetical protein [Bacteroidia bacterium]
MITFVLSDSKSMEQKSTSIAKLTALWALSESGLGGFMHAFKIPFTGFFLGGFAIVIITLIAGLAKNKMAAILKATLLVVLVKAAASPHSPPMAYIAVAFQGSIGAICYGVLPSIKIAGPLFGGVALLESAIQKFLVMTLIFGKSLWEAIDLFVLGILKDLHLHTNFSFSYWLICTYTLIYVIWGLVLGWWSSALWSRILLNKSNIIHTFETLQQPKLADMSNKKQTSKWKKLLGFAGILSFIITIFLFNDLGGKAGYAILRTIAALLMIWFVINPIFKWLLQQWIKRKSSEQQQGLTEVLSLLPELKMYVQPAFNMAKQQHNGVKRYSTFVLNLITLALFRHEA